MKNMNIHRYLHPILWLGDILVLGLVTIIGFATHGNVVEAGSRTLTTFIPLLAGWLIAAWPSNVLDYQFAQEFRSLWKVSWAMFLAVPLALFFRAWLLDRRPIVPVFVLVMMAVSIASILVWRFIFILIFRKLVVN